MPIAKLYVVPNPQIYGIIMTTDLSKNSVEQVLDLIKTSNGLADSALTANDVELIDLTSLTDDPSNKNTAVTINSISNRRYTGSVPIKYNRLEMNGLLQYGDLTIVIGEGEGEAEILAAINAAYGCNLSFDDVQIIGSELVDFDGDVVTFTAKATSLAWLGGLDLIVKWNQIALSSILVNSNLNGLVWPYMFKGLIELIPSQNFGSGGAQRVAILGNRIILLGLNASSYVRGFYDPETQTYQSGGGVSRGGGSYEFIADGKLFFASRSATNFDIYTYTDFLTSAATEYKRYILPSGLSNSWQFLYKDNHDFYFLFGAGSSAELYRINEIDDTAVSLAVLTGGIPSTTVDVYSKSCIIDGNLYFPHADSILKYNLASGQVSSFVSGLTSTNGHFTFSKLDDRLVVVSMVTGTIRVYSTEGDYEEIGNLEDFEAAKSHSAIEYDNAVYLINNVSGSAYGKAFKIT